MALIRPADLCKLSVTGGTARQNCRFFDQTILDLVIAATLPFHSNFSLSKGIFPDHIPCD